MENQNTPSPELSNVFWDPHETIEITGLQLASLLQPLDLLNVPMNSVPVSTLAEIYAIAEKAKKDIIDKMAEEGKLRTETISQS